MKYDESHPSDEQLLLQLEGELAGREAEQLRLHLAACWQCRTRSQSLDAAIAAVTGIHQGAAELPPADGPRALLKAQLAQLAARPLPNSWWNWALPAAAAAAFCLAAFALLPHFPWRAPKPSLILSIPDSRLTPGAAILASRQAVCSQANTKNKAVPVALQRKVFEEYGIAGAQPQAYEVDYLVTPALGGADDIRNLWPHSYSATVWNAQVKDALEDRLRDMVCGGNLDLTEAQQAIAENWIAAYKKYFHTEAPLEEHSLRRSQ